MREAGGRGAVEIAARETSTVLVSSGASVPAPSFSVEVEAFGDVVLDQERDLRDGVGLGIGVQARAPGAGHGAAAEGEVQRASAEAFVGQRVAAVLDAVGAQRRSVSSGSEAAAPAPSRTRAVTLTSSPGR